MTHDEQLREQRIIEAAMRYDIEKPTDVDAYLRTVDADIRDEVAELIADVVVVDLLEPVPQDLTWEDLTPEEQALADRIAPRTWEKFQRQFKGLD